MHKSDNEQEVKPSMLLIMLIVCFSILSLLMTHNAKMSSKQTNGTSTTAVPLEAIDVTYPADGMTIRLDMKHQIDCRTQFREEGCNNFLLEKGWYIPADKIFWVLEEDNRGLNMFRLCGWDMGHYPDTLPKILIEGSITKNRPVARSLWEEETGENMGPALPASRIKPLIQEIPDS